MFTFLSAESLNQAAALPSGVYLGRATGYRLDEDAGEFLLAEFSIQGSGIVTFAEILIKLQGAEEVLYRDFLKMPDGLWRDSHGKKAQSLAELLPPETLSAMPFEEVTLDPINHVGVGA